MKILTIKAEAQLLGSDVRDAIKDAKRICMILGCNVEFTFNRVEVLVTAESDEYDVWETYLNGLHDK